MNPPAARLEEVLAALSLAADVGFGQPLETGLRVCTLGLAMGERMGLDDDELGRVFRLALLRTSAAPPTPRRSPRSPATRSS